MKSTDESLGIKTKHRFGGVWTNLKTHTTMNIIMKDIKLNDNYLHELEMLNSRLRTAEEEFSNAKSHFDAYRHYFEAAPTSENASSLQFAASQYAHARRNLDKQEEALMKLLDKFDMNIAE